jgi:hypothetical protein
MPALLRSGAAVMGTDVDGRSLKGGIPPVWLARLVG